MKKLILFIAYLAISQISAGQIVSGSFVHDNIIRNFDLHLPTGWTSNDSLPLLLDFHYLGADGRDEDTLTQFNPIADAEGFIVCHPWGFFSDWNVGQNAPFGSGTKDVDYINVLIDTLHSRYGIDLNRVYAVGMGQGGFMVHRLACELSGRLAAVAAVGASIADSAAFYCQTTRPVPVMMIQGTADSVIYYYTGLPGIWGSVQQLVNLWKAHNNALGNEITVNLPDTANEGSHIISHRWLGDQNSEVLLYEVVNGGFAWPGANRDLGSGGNRNMDINASRHIWDFLKRYTLTTFTPIGMEETVDVDLQMNVFPNPAKELLHVSVSTGKLPNVKVLDLQGREAFAPITFQTGNSADVNVSHLPNGMYLLQADGVSKRFAVMH
ncbi:MAG: T9SS type A sorting domain-containing protein [Bacteroidetes bacterium]|nr:T9SS type A sorting domain-containing protein [Bacteroidota bacterium]MBP8073792.1 T9SS type A sorting domain-containing protein [Bacteroidia bacterium]